MRRYWVSWIETCDPQYPSDPRPARDWQTAPEWWCSGYSGDGGEPILCALVEATSIRAAWDLIRAHWHPKSSRFVNLVEADWRPDPGRFPPRSRP